jgi:hypothetical protein
MSLPGAPSKHAAIVAGISRGLGAALAAGLLGLGFKVMGIGWAGNPACH